MVEFLPKVIIKKLANHYVDVIGWVESEKQLRKWLQTEGRKVCRREIDTWLDTNNRGKSYIRFWDWYRRNRKPIANNQLIMDRTKELINYIYNCVDNATFAIDGARQGKVKLVAFEFLYNVVKSFHPFYNGYCITKPLIDGKSIVHFVDLPKVNITNWDIEGLSRQRENVIRQTFEQLGILKISESRWEQKLAKRWVLKIPFNLFSKKDFYNFSMTSRETFFDSLTEKEQLSLIGRRNLTKLVRTYQKNK